MTAGDSLCAKDGVLITDSLSMEAAKLWGEGIRGRENGLADFSDGEVFWFLL